MKRRMLRVLGGAAVAAAVLAMLPACSSDDKNDACKLEIGFFGVLSGANSPVLGQNVRDGAKLAVDQYNKGKSGDACVNLREYDSLGDPNEASKKAPSVVQNKKLIGLVGPVFSGESEATMPTFESAGLPIISPSATRTSLSSKGWKVFHRGLGNDKQQSDGIVKYINDTAKPEKVFLVDDKTAYGTGLTEEVKKAAGSKIIGQDSVQVGQTDFSATITKIKASEADFVFYGGYYSESAPFTKQLRNAGVKAKFMSGDGSRSPQFVEGAGKEAAEGAILSCPCLVKLDDQFAKDYKASTGKDADIYSSEAFDAANIFLKGIDAGKKTRADLLSFVNTYEGEGVSKKFKWSANGELDPSVVRIWMYVVKNGVLVPEVAVQP